MKECSNTEKCCCKYSELNEGDCTSPHHGKDCCCSEKFLKLADEAWMEVLKEKIKDEIRKEKECGLIKLAEIIAKANSEKWKHKIGLKMKRENYKDTLKEYFSEKD